MHAPAAFVHKLAQLHHFGMLQRGRLTKVVISQGCVHPQFLLKLITYVKCGACVCSYILAVFISTIMLSIYINVFLA